MTTTNDARSKALPKQMQQHTYGIMYEEEGTHWWFVGRRRILESMTREALEAFRGPGRPRILDVGCGTGANLEMLGAFGDAEGVDVSEDALEFCKARGLDRVKLGAAERLPWDDASFDLVTALDVVEHLDDDVAGLEEMFRVLKPGGTALFFVPAFMFLWGVQDDISHHRTRYTREGLLRSVKAAGFVPARSTYANVMLFAPIAAGRFLMRLTGFRPESENNLNLPVFNRPLAALFGAERHWLRRFSIPFGVSIICIARKLA